MRSFMAVLEVSTAALYKVSESGFAKEGTRTDTLGICVNRLRISGHSLQASLYVTVRAVFMRRFGPQRLFEWVILETHLQQPQDFSSPFIKGVTFLS